MEKRYTQIAVIFFLTAVFATSCSVQKRHYTGGYYVARHGNYQKQRQLQSKSGKKSNTSRVLVLEQQSEDIIPELSLSADADLKTHNGRSAPANLAFVIGDTCDLIRFKNYVEIKCKILEVSPTEIKYRKCKDPGGPILSIAITDVQMVQYSDGTIHQYNHNTPAKQLSDYDAREKNKKTEGFGIAGTFIGIAGLLVAGILLGLTAIVFGAISMNRIEKNQEKYQQKKGWAIASLIVGFIAAVGASIVLMNSQ